MQSLELQFVGDDGLEEMKQLFNKFDVVGWEASLPPRFALASVPPNS